MKSLFRAARFGIESLRGSGVSSARKEAIMLDVAFVALGIVVLTLMGVYSLALRQL
jgi:chorismate synthase